MAVKKGKTYQIEIEDAAYEGKGIGHIDGMAVFVKNTAPGDVVTARIRKKRKKYCEAQLEEIITPSSIRVEPTCRHADVCGGCTWQHVPYSEQLKFKTRHVADHLQRIGGFSDLHVEECLGSDRELNYRNKMEYTFGARRWLTEEEIKQGGDVEQKYFALGMHIPGRFDRILDLQECHLQDPISFRILDFVRAYALEHNLRPYDTHNKNGYLRNLMIRNATHTDDLMVNIVTYRNKPDQLTPLVDAIMEEFPEVTTIINNVNDTWSPTAIGRYEEVHHGPGYITEYIHGLSFRVEANTFFQTNTLQAEKLYEQALNYAEITPEDVVYDLYCGVGSLTLCLAQKAKKAVGIEISESSVEKANENAETNGFTNTHFEPGDMKDVFSDEVTEKYGKPDVLVTDPPRAGMHEDVIHQIRELRPERMVYISCNSSTLARDLSLLADLYSVEQVQPVDMFPQTYHIETVARLKLK